MTNSPDDLEQRFRQLEREVDRAFTGDRLKSADPEAESQQQPTTNGNPVESGQTLVDSAKAGGMELLRWINGLTGPVKVVAVIALGLAVFSILNFVFRLVVAAISVGIMALVGYVLYKLFFAPTAPPSNS